LAFTTGLAAQEEDSGSAKPAKKTFLDEEKAPFSIIWEKQFEFSHTTQQAGQNINSLSFTSTFLLSESGSFLSTALETSRLKVEGAESNTGSLTLAGGLGLGFFSQSLSVGFRGGESALQEMTLSLASGFRFSDSFSGSLIFGGSSGNHQGPVAELLPIPGALGELMVEIDTKSAHFGLGVSYVAWNWLMVSLGIQNEYNITYQVQNLAKTAALPMEQVD
jgi:hypothetical protein